MSGLNGMDEDPDRVSTIGVRGRRVWLYPTWFRGRLLTWRTAVHWLLVVMLLIGPWIDVNGHAAIRVDITARRIYFWGLQLFATDGSYLLFLVGMVALGVFLVTALFGRAWCGWACPQTVFLESVIRPIERALEGSPVQQRKLNEGPWTATKVIRKLIKWSAFMVVSGAIGTTFVAYFLGREGIIEAQADPWAYPAGTFTFVFITAALFFDFAWFREQTCIVVCPYGRFQSVLLDANSLAVGYDARRGEPRGKKGTIGAGDCIDCKRCVHVCPTGIDIRKGPQMECVQCMACVDACDDVMAKLHRPLGLIRIASEHALAGKPTRVLRPRVVVYALALSALVLTFSFTLAGREVVEVRLVRQGDVPFSRMPDGRVQNSLRVRIANKDNDARAFRLELVDAEGIELVTPISPFVVAPGRVENMPMFVLIDAKHQHAGTSSAFVVRVVDDHGFAEDLHGSILTGGAQR